MKYSNKINWIIITAVFVLAVSGCSKNEEVRKDKNTAVPKPYVIVSKVQKGPIFKAYTAMGSITPNDIARIIPKVTGRVMRIYASEGSQVRAGETLMQINDADYRILMQGLTAASKAAEVNLKKSSRDLERAEMLHKEQAIAEQLYQDAQSKVDGDRFLLERAKVEISNASRSVGECRVVAPISGIVTNKSVNEGELTSPQSPYPAFTVENMNRVKLEVDLSEDAFGYLDVGNKCLVTVDAIPDKTFEGYISKIHPSINPISKSFKVIITVDNPDLKLRSGMTARAQVVQKTRNDAINAPKSAFLKGEDSFYVFKLTGTKVIKVPVIIGIEGSDSYEIVQGLQPGDFVVIQGQVGLDNGMQVRAEERKYSPAGLVLSNAEGNGGKKSPASIPQVK